MAQQHCSLWVMPEGDLCEELQELITELAREHGGPVFPPHVTILGGIPGYTEEQAVEKTMQLARKLRPYVLQCDRVAASTEFHRCLFVRMKPTRHILQTFELARGVFGHTDYEEHMPHLSLFYGTPTSTEKATMAKRIPSIEGWSFRATAVHLFDTSFSPETWRPITSVPIR